MPKHSLQAGITPGGRGHYWLIRSLCSDACNVAIVNILVKWFFQFTVYNDGPKKLKKKTSDAQRTFQSLIAFHKERVHNAVEIVIFGTVVQIERSRISCEVLAFLPVEKTCSSTKRKTQSYCDWIEIAWEDRPVSDEKMAYVSMFIGQPLAPVCMILKCKHKRGLFFRDAWWCVFVAWPWLGQLFIMFTIATSKHLGFYSCFDKGCPTKA